MKCLEIFCNGVPTFQYFRLNKSNFKLPRNDTVHQHAEPGYANQ